MPKKGIFKTKTLHLPKGRTTKIENTKDLHMTSRTSDERLVYKGNLYIQRTFHNLSNAPTGYDKYCTDNKYRFK